MPNLLVDTNADGHELVPAPGAYQFIRVIGLNLTAAAPVVVTLKSGSTVIWKSYAMDDANSLGGIVIPTDENNTIDCAPGQALNLGLSGTVGVAGSIEYVVKGRPNTALAPLG
jgi:hypothetical protein